MQTKSISPPTVQPLIPIDTTISTLPIPIPYIDPKASTSLPSIQLLQQENQRLKDRIQYLESIAKQTEDMHNKQLLVMETRLSEEQEKVCPTQMKKKEFSCN